MKEDYSRFFLSDFARYYNFDMGESKGGSTRSFQASLIMTKHRHFNIVIHILDDIDNRF